MNNKNCFIDYKFLGVKPFTKTLEENSIEYVLFEDDVPVKSVFDERSQILDKESDIIETGKCLNNNIEVYFAQFGIKITKSYRSYIVFIYDHHPVQEDLIFAADSLENIINEKINSVDPSEITSMQ